MSWPKNVPHTPADGSIQCTGQLHKPSERLLPSGGAVVPKKQRMSGFALHAPRYRCLQNQSGTVFYDSQRLRDGLVWSQSTRKRAQQFPRTFPIHLDASAGLRIHLFGIFCTVPCF